jgi:AcrR family transcriptional regulator
MAERTASRRKPGEGARARASKPKRRKDERPQEIVEAALEEFAQKGFAAARLEDVASRAGVSKGLPYLYFKTKEELFKAVLKTFIKPGFDALIEKVHTTELSPEAFLRGPFLAFLQEFARSRRALVVRLMIAEGHKHPELTRFHLENVINPGIEALQLLIDRGVAQGEFRPTALRDFPQLIVAPMLMSVIWRALFERHRHLDTDALLDTHVGLVLDAIRATGPLDETKGRGR